MEEVPRSPANVKQAVPLLAVSMMEASLRFYVDGLGFKMTKSWIADGAVRRERDVGDLGVKDPDGYRLEFESETETPEDTQFSESEA